MPDLPVEPTSSGRYPDDMESRVAALEHIARTTIERALERQRAETRSLQDRLECRMDILAARQHADFHTLLGVMLRGFATMLEAFGAMLGVIAHGFHWL